jgi:hypothetical protein
MALPGLGPTSKLTAQSRAPLCVSVLALALLVGCQGGGAPKASSDAAAEADTLVPDYSSALQSHPSDYIGFIKSWFQGANPEVESVELVRYSLPAPDAMTERAAETLVAGHEAFCKGNGGQITREPPTLTCVGADNKVIARMAVQVFHSSADQPGALQFSAESSAWIARLNEERLADFRRVIDTLAGNGVGGSVLLTSGESFEVVRFGRLSMPDFYAVKTPEHGLTWLSDIVSVKWTPNGIAVTPRKGEAFEEHVEGMTPHNTLVRLRPTDDLQLKAEPLSHDEPLRFVYIDPVSKLARQARVRADGQVLQLTISSKPSRYRGGMIDTRFSAKARDAFRKALVADARKAAANGGKRTDQLDLDDAKLRADLEQLGRGGPCARSQSDDRLRSGDIAYTEFLVCAEYRKEAEAVKAADGELKPDTTPLLFLSRAARAPWYDFGGVLR